MLNMMTFKDYEKKLNSFNFDELVSQESAEDIAKPVFAKVRYQISVADL